MSAGRRIEVRGTVQGVGFRPWVYRLAQRVGVRGRVRNNPRGVTIEAFAVEGVLDAFLQQLREDVPSSARIVDLRSVPIPSEAVNDFVIETSEPTGLRALSIPPDLGTCPECEAEVLDPEDRRHGYAFTNCTVCGPRFTIATDIPYDRASTTMACFDMCPACQREYDDVNDRRFHAQPNACPVCGPTLTFVHASGADEDSADPLTVAAASLNAGAIVAVKGLGGFHLACDAANADAVALLRTRKYRDEKPFAVMVHDLDAARSLATLSPEEEALLTAPERPIVLLQRREGAPVAAEVAPETPLLGVFLPYTPLHHLLLTAADRPLVMTSANPADEPICKDNDEAKRRLEGIADAFLLHDRDIATRCDDSVARVIAGKPTLLRRSRGFVPRPFGIARPVTRPVLACGAHLKNTFCLTTGDTAYFGPHIGDLETVAALRFFEEAIDRMQTLLSVRPEVIAHDLHPGYLSTRYAMARNEPIKVGIQHHHAHVVSAMGEHGLQGPVLGIAYDGTGYGEDDTSWGGEILLAFEDRFERLASFRPIHLPGGNKAMREVWRAAFALVHDAFGGDPPLDALPLFKETPDETLRVVSQMIDRNLNVPAARGVGRYFDAFGALVLNRPESRYEGQVAIAWNHVADPDDMATYPFAIHSNAKPIEVDLRPTVRVAVQELISGVPPEGISARFHNTLVEATAAVVQGLVGQIGRPPVVLTGGVFHNARLAEGLFSTLSNDFSVSLHGEVPPGDGGIALGQALIADAIVRDKG